MRHLDQIASIRAHLGRGEYSDALRIGREELASERDSSELLVLMATAVMLGDAGDGTLEEARQWLERATKGDPRNVDACLELGHFLDAVADEPESASVALQSAVNQALAYLEDAILAMHSAGVISKEVREHIREALQKAISTLDANGPP